MCRALAAAGCSECRVRSIILMIMFLLSAGCPPGSPTVSNRSLESPAGVSRGLPFRGSRNPPQRVIVATHRERVHRVTSDEVRGAWSHSLGAQVDATDAGGTSGVLSQGERASAT